MDVVLEFLSNNLVLVLVVAVIVLELVFEYELAVKRLKDIFMAAEEKAKAGLFDTMEEKYEWVLENGYKYLPPVLKIVITKDLFKKFVTTVYNKGMKFLTSKELL